MMLVNQTYTVSRCQQGSNIPVGHDDDTVKMFSKQQEKQIITLVDQKLHLAFSGVFEFLLVRFVGSSLNRVRVSY